MAKKILLYFGQNPAFPHLTKIGSTSKLVVEDRGLSASNVPEDFGYPAVFKCEDAEIIEKKVHKQFAKYRHLTQTGRKTEFFWSGCVQDAIAYVRDLKGVYDNTENETEEIEVVDQTSGERKIKKIAAKTTFQMIGLPVGTEVCFQNDKNRRATVLDDKNKISFEGKTGAISEIAKSILNYSVSGFFVFYYNGQRLFDLRPSQEDKD